MAEPHLTHPGEVVWYAQQGPVPVLGPCPHTKCPHDMLRVVAEGPDFDHYTLDRCDVSADRDGCNGQCRAWCAEWPNGEGPAFSHTRWLHLDTDPAPSPADPVATWTT